MTQAEIIENLMHIAEKMQIFQRELQKDSIELQRYANWLAKIEQNKETHELNS